MTLLRRIWFRETPFWAGFWTGMNIITVVALALMALFLLIPAHVVLRCLGQ